MSSQLTLWESNKENIQPLPQGRKVGLLTDALVGDLDRLTISQEEPQDLEAWHKHIEQLEQTHISGGKIIERAIERCIEIYHDQKQFKQDPKLVDIFLKFTRFCEEPCEVFSFMYANSIGTLLSSFYLNWSWQYEIKKNVKRAEDLLKLGIKNLASPREVLEEARQQLKFRIDRMMRNGQLDDLAFTGSESVSAMMSARESQAELANGGIRAALQTLKVSQGKKKGTGSGKVAINRIGSAVDQKSVGGLKSQTKIVNGVRVAKNRGLGAASGGSSTMRAPLAQSRLAAVPPTTSESSAASISRSNAPVPVFKDLENEIPLTDENHENHDQGLASIIRKVPTTQHIQLVGRTGPENAAPIRATLQVAPRAQ